MEHLGFGAANIKAGVGYTTKQTGWWLGTKIKDGYAFLSQHTTREGGFATRLGT